MISRETVCASTSTRKVFVEGTYRAAAPAETVARAMRHASAMGITRVADITGLDLIGIPVVTVCRPNSRSLATSQGKGITLDAAKASGLMECIELHHAEHITLPLLLGSYRDLAATHRVVDVSELPLVNNTRYSDDLQILWIEGYDLFTDVRVWVPFEIVHATAKIPPPQGSGCFSATSNGLASGNTIAEAILHGACEVIERDATSLWQAAGLEVWNRTRLNLTSVDDPCCRLLLDKLSNAGMDVAAWETTSDIKVPSFLVQISDRAVYGLHSVHSFTGMGCHVDRSIALSRALTESAQCRLTLISGSRDDMFAREYATDICGGVVRDRYPTASVDESRLIRFQSIPTACGETIERDLEECLGRLADAGVRNLIAFDLTKPEYGIPVVRVVIPGLEAPDDDPSYMPGPRARRILEVRP